MPESKVCDCTGEKEVQTAPGTMDCEPEGNLHIHLQKEVQTLTEIKSLFKREREGRGVIQAKAKVGPEWHQWLLIHQMPQRGSV